MVGLFPAKIAPVFSYIWEVGRMGGWIPRFPVPSLQKGKDRFFPTPI
jgi:hypothetical protein